jgi:hypothetical protein
VNNGKPKSNEWKIERMQNGKQNRREGIEEIMRERRVFGANGGGAWERWEEDCDGKDGGEDDDDGVLGVISMPGYS